MGWDVVWQLALKEFGAEPVEMKILILLAVSLCVLMMLTGLRYTVRPVRPQAPSPVQEPPARLFAAPPATLSDTPEPMPAPALQPVRVRKPSPLSARKRSKQVISRHKTLRPKIRRRGKSMPSPNN